LLPGPFAATPIHTTTRARKAEAIKPNIAALWREIDRVPGSGRLAEITGRLLDAEWRERQKAEIARLRRELRAAQRRLH
jgi:hypothetical protein